MAHTRLLLRDEARAKLLAGATTLADAVRVTLGPRSRSILLERKFGIPLVCNDGVTVAKQVDLPEPVENLGARVLREAAVKTGDTVGDGTTTATILAHAIFAEGLRNVVAGANAIDLKRGIDRAAKAAVTALRACARPVTSRREKVQIACISAHNDASIGEMVADAMERVGASGVVSVEEAKGTETVLEVVEGLQFDRGYLSPYFVTNTERMQAVLEEPRVLLHEKRVASVKELVPLLEQVAKEGRGLLIVAEEVEGDALATLVVNKIRGTLACVAVKAPGYGDRRKELLQDIAVLTGGRAILSELGLKLEDVSHDDVGTARRVVVDRDSTTIIGGGGTREAIGARCADIRARIAKTTSDYDREKLEERLARLSGGVAVIRVGAPSEPDLKARKEAFEDAINATKAAVAEGVVPGGGVALLRASDAVAALERDCSGDELVGVRILGRSLEAPMRQIAVNSGYDGGVVIERVRASGASQGFDAERGVHVDMFEAGIIDALEVVRVGLENAASVAGVLLLAEGTLTEIPEKSAGPPERDGHWTD